MASAVTPKLIRVLGLTVPLCICIVTHAQCPVATVIVKGHVEHSIVKDHYRVRVQLVYPRHRPGDAGEVTVEDGRFQIPVEFVTVQSSLFSNLPKSCGRKPQTVVITLLNGEQKSDEVTLEFPRDFKMADPSAYALRSELVLNAGSR